MMTADYQFAIATLTESLIWMIYLKDDDVMIGLSRLEECQSLLLSASSVGFFSSSYPFFSG